MNNKKHASQLHAEHLEWLNKLAFYKDDLKIMKSRLEEIAGDNASKTILAEVEHFQNQFILQNDRVDVLKHKINEHESFIQRDIKSNPVASDHRLYADSPQMREEMNQFEEIINALRSEFTLFVAKSKVPF